MGSCWERSIHPQVGQTQRQHCELGSIHQVYIQRSINIMVGMMVHNYHFIIPSYYHMNEHLLNDELILTLLP